MDARVPRPHHGPGASATAPPRPTWISWPSRVRALRRILRSVSPGGLPKGLALAEPGPASIRRDPLILDLQDCPEPRFNGGRFVSVKFRPNPEVRRLPPAGGIGPRVGGEATGEVTGEVGTPTGEVTGEVEAPTREVTEEVGAHTAQVIDQAGEVTAQVKRTADQGIGEVMDATAQVGDATAQVEGSTAQVTAQVEDATAQVAGEVHHLAARLLGVMSGEMGRQGIQDALGLRHRNYFRKAYLHPALRAGLIEMTIPDKPRSNKQRYRLTPAGSERARQLKDTRQ